MAERFEHFELHRVIGGGGSGASIYHATEELVPGMAPRDVALKVLPPLGDRDAARRDAFLREAQAIVTLSQSGHPNIVQCFGCGISGGGRPWISMQYLGQNLQQRLTDAPAPPAGVAKMLRDVLCGLYHIRLHHPKLLHNDLKPGNLLIDDEGNYRIIDFGVAADSDSDHTQDVRTAKYCAPEVTDGTLGPTGPYSDLYSLGFIAYEMALGQTLFRTTFPDMFGATAIVGVRKWLQWHSSLTQHARPLGEALAGFPPDLSDLVARMMAKPPAERFQEPADVLLAGGPRFEPLPPQLAAAAVPPPAASVPPSTPRPPAAPPRTMPVYAPPPKPTPDRRLLLAIVGGMAVLLVVAIVKPLSHRATSIVLDAPGPYVTTRPTLALVGRVDGLPDDAKLVWVSGGRHAFVTLDARSAFEFSLPLDKPGRVEGELIVAGDDRVAVARLPVVVTRDAPTAVALTVRTVPTAAGVRLRLRPSTGPAVDLTTGDGGEASLDLPPGAYDVTFDDNGDWQCRDSHTIDTGFGPASTIDLRLLRKRLPVTVTVAPPQASVALTDARGRPVAARLAVDVAGEARVDLAPGAYRYTARLDPLPEATAEFEVKRDEDNRVSIVVGPAAGGADAFVPAAGGDGWANLERMRVQSLSDDDFFNYLRNNVPLDTLDLRKPPAGERVVRVSGAVLNDDDLQALRSRLKPAGGRVSLAVSVKPDYVVGRLTARLRQAGVRNASAKKLGELLADDRPRGPATVPWRIVVDYSESPGVSRETIETLCNRYTLDPTNLDVRRPY